MTPAGLEQDSKLDFAILSQRLPDEDWIELLGGEVNHGEELQINVIMFMKQQKNWSIKQNQHFQYKQHLFLLNVEKRFW